MKDIVIFPYMVLPLFITREKSIKSLEAALSKDRLIFLVAQKDIAEDDPSPEDLYPDRNSCPRDEDAQTSGRKDQDPCPGTLEGLYQRDPSDHALFHW